MISSHPFSQIFLYIQSLANSGLQLFIMEKGKQIMVITIALLTHRMSQGHSVLRCSLILVVYVQYSVLSTHGCKPDITHRCITWISKLEKKSLKYVLKFCLVE